MELDRWLILGAYSIQQKVERDVMKVLSLHSAVVAMTAILATVGSVAAQESSPATNTAAAPSIAPEPVRLSYGVADVLKLSRAKVSEDVLVAFIQNSGRRYAKFLYKSSLFNNNTLQ